MAIAKPTSGLRHIDKGLSQKTTALKPKKSPGLYFRYYSGSCVMVAQSPYPSVRVPVFIGQRELYCYADMLYHRMSDMWRHYLIMWYRILRESGNDMIIPWVSYRRARAEIPKKEVSVWNLWITTIEKQKLDGYNDFYIRSKWIITDVKIEDGRLKAQYQYTNKTPDLVLPDYFDEDLLRFLLRGF
jgi:hypothetical protein